MSMAFTRSADLLAGANEGETVQLWDLLGRPRLRSTFTSHVGDISSVAFNPARPTLAIAGLAGVELRDVGASAPPGYRILPGRRPAFPRVAFSPNGMFLVAVSGNGAIRVWGVGHTPRVLATRSADGSGIVSVAYSRRGVLATGMGDGSVKLWDVVGGKLRLTGTLPGDNAAIDSLAFSPGGRVLAAGDRAGNVRLWDPAQHVPEGNPLPLNGAGSVSSVSFNPDGNTLVAAYQDDSIRIWKGVTWVRYADLKRTVCRMVSNDVGKAAWEKLVPQLPYRRQCGE